MKGAIQKYEYVSEANGVLKGHHCELLLALFFLDRPSTVTLQSLINKEKCAFFRIRINTCCAAEKGGQMHCTNNLTTVLVL